MSTWLFDLGNSRLKCAPLDAGINLGSVREIGHDGNAFDRAIEQLPSGFDTAYVASVASPALTVALLDALTARCTRITRVRTQWQCAGVRIAYAEPSRLGVDRFLGLLAAHARGDGPWLIVSAGSALTVDLLDGAGQHRGGVIAPSPEHRRAALAARFPALAFAGGEATDFAADTADALAGGSLGAALGLVERCHRQATRLLGRAPRLLVSGGGGARLAEGLEMESEQVPFLVLEGLAVYAAQAEGGQA